MGSSSLVDTFATRLSAQPLNYRASAPGIQEVHLELLGGELYYITVGERDNDAKHKSSLLRLPTPRILPLAVASAPVRSHPHRYVMRTCAVRPPWVRPCIRFRQFLQPAARTSACALQAVSSVGVSRTSQQDTPQGAVVDGSKEVNCRCPLSLI